MARRRGRFLGAAAAAATLVAVAGCVSAPSGESVPSAPVGVNVSVTAGGAAAGRPPAVTGTGLRALWQGAPWDDLTVAGGLVLGVAENGHTAQVRAVRALTGAPMWTATFSGTPSQVTGVTRVMVAGSTVIVLAGHEVGQGQQMIHLAASDYVALDLATGRKLWEVTSGFQFQSLPVAVAGNLVLTMDSRGDVVARAERSGAVAWRQPPPAGCRLMGMLTGDFDPPLSLAGNGSLAAVSYVCPGRTVAQRLQVATGKPVWTWSARRTHGIGPGMLVAAVTPGSGLVLLSGDLGSTAGLSRSYPWPTQLGPAVRNDVVLALDAATGRPRWNEQGSPVENETFTALPGGVACESVVTGVECRDDVTGAATMPPLVTGQNSGATSPYGEDQAAGAAGGIVAVTVAPWQSDHLAVRAVRARGGATAADVHLAISTTAATGGTFRVFVVAAGLLPGGTPLVLVRRLDVPGYPVVALAGTASTR